MPTTELDDLTVRLEIDGLLGRHPSQVSFGEQQRAGIARALLGTPRLAVLDEPTGHQDEARAALVVEALLAARARGTCAPIESHLARVDHGRQRLRANRPTTRCPDRCHDG